MWIAIAGIGVLGLLVGVVLFGSRSGDRESGAIISYIRERSRK